MSEDNLVKRRRISVKSKVGDVMASQMSTNSGNKDSPVVSKAPDASAAAFQTIPSFPESDGQCDGQ